MSYPNEEDAKLWPAVPVWVEHVQRFRVLASHHPVEVGPHVRRLSFDGVGHVVGEHACACGHGVEQLHYLQILLRGLPLDTVADLAPVDERRPQWLLEQLRLVGGLLLALQRDPVMVGAHLLHELAGGDGNLEEEDGDAAGVFLDREGDAGLSVSEEGAGGAGRAADVAVGRAAAAGDGRVEAAGRG